MCTALGKASDPEGIHLYNLGGHLAMSARFLIVMSRGWGWGEWEEL